MGCSFPLLFSCCVYFLTIWLKIVWLMGMRSILSIFLTNFKHIGHLTLLFLNKDIVTYKTSWGREYKKCARSESWSLEFYHESCNPFYRADICPCLAACWQTHRFLCDIGLEDFRLAWRRRLLDFIVSSFNSNIKQKAEIHMLFQSLIYRSAL